MESDQIFLVVLRPATARGADTALVAPQRFICIGQPVEFAEATPKRSMQGIWLSDMRGFTLLADHVPPPCFNCSMNTLTAKFPRSLSTEAKFSNSWAMAY